MHEALHAAVDRLDLASVALLLRHGAHVNARTRGGHKALNFAVRALGSRDSTDLPVAEEILAMLLSAGAQPTRPLEILRIGPLFTDLRRSLELLIQASVWDPCIHPEGVISDTAQLANPTALATLLRYGLDPNERSGRDGATFFHRMLCAALDAYGHRRRFVRCLLLLLLRGVDLDAPAFRNGTTHRFHILAQRFFVPLNVIDDALERRRVCAYVCRALWR